MPRLDYKTCKGCNRHTDDCGLLSRTRLCADCGDQAELANVAALRAHEGPQFTYWRHRIAASVGAVLLDDLRETP